MEHGGGQLPRGDLARRAGPRPGPDLHDPRLSPFRLPQAKGLDIDGTRLLRLARLLHRRAVHPLLAFALPSRCFGCGLPLGRIQRLAACPACWAGLRPLHPPLCAGCGLPRAEATDLLGPAAGRCARCILGPLAVAGVRAAVAYDRLGRAFLLRAKLGRRPELLEVLGSQLARVIELSGWADRCSVIVPVPSHPWTDLCRGFSPATVLARRVGRVLGLPVRARALVQRLAGGQAAKRLSAAARRRRSARAFRARSCVEPVSVLLVDDVMTTGASAEACGRALLEAGAREVRVAVWARTLPRGSS